jgi:hypothetical protein
MYALNPTNSLYFYPHKLSFSPVLKTADNDRRNRWFPGYDVSVAWPWAQPADPCVPRAATSTWPDEDRQDRDAAPVEDDRPGHFQAEPSER